MALRIPKVTTDELSWPELASDGVVTCLVRWTASAMTWVVMQNIRSGFIANTAPGGVEVLAMQGRL